MGRMSEKSMSASFFAAMAAASRFWSFVSFLIGFPFQAEPGCTQCQYICTYDIGRLALPSSWELGLEAAAEELRAASARITHAGRHGPDHTSWEGASAAFLSMTSTPRRMRLRA